jgi:hypothetical protein
MKLHVGMMIVLMTAISCKMKHAQSETRGLDPLGIEYARPETQKDKKAHRFAKKKHRFALKAQEQTPTETLHFNTISPEAVAQSSKAIKGESERNYEAELLSLVGDPSVCISSDEAEAAPPKVTVQFNVVVTDQGVISRLEVSSNNLSKSAIECFKKQLSPQRFKPVVEGAPKTIEATLTLLRQAVSG